MLDDPKFKSLGIDYMFALHNIPQEDMHTVLVMESGFSAEVLSFSLIIKGRESHASSPETGNNPAKALAKIISALSELENTDPTQDNFSLLTPVYSNMGQKSYGISPADAEIHYTIRTWSTNSMNELKELIISKSTEIMVCNNLEFSFDWFEYFPASQNDGACNEIVKQAADLKNIAWVNKQTPFRFGEDFGRFSSVFPTAMFGLGAGVNTPPLHDAAYDFPDELIDTGTTIFKGIIEIMLISASTT
jgi:metal-dependent amidase/aminoacylase/carboxypeptidase family protein